MDYKEVFKKMIMALITSLLTALAATGGLITKSVIISICIGALLATWNVFLQYNSPVVVAKTTACRVNWATKLRRY